MILGATSIGSVSLGGRHGTAESPVPGHYNALGSALIPVIKGVRYLYTPGVNDASAWNQDAAENWQRFIATAQFTAWGDTVRFTGTPAALITATLQPLTGWANAAGGLLVVDWLKHTFGGVRQLFFVGSDGFINLYEHLDEDMLADELDNVVIRPIADVLLTRGYRCEDHGSKRFARGSVTLSTWNSSYTVDAVYDGVSEELAALPATTPDRTRYIFPFNAAPYDRTNSDDDYLTPGREDYSVPIDATDSFPGITLDNGGMTLDEDQTVQRGFTMRRQGQYAQLRIRSTHGRTTVVTTEVEARKGQRRNGVIA